MALVTRLSSAVARDYSGRHVRLQDALTRKVDRALFATATADFLAEQCWANMASDTAFAASHLRATLFTLIALRDGGGDMSPQQALIRYFGQRLREPALLTWLGVDVNVTPPLKPDDPMRGHAYVEADVLRASVMRDALYLPQYALLYTNLWELRESALGERSRLDVQRTAVAPALAEWEAKWTGLVDDARTAVSAWYEARRRFDICQRLADPALEAVEDALEQDEKAKKKAYDKRFSLAAFFGELPEPAVLLAFLMNRRVLLTDMFDLTKPDAPLLKLGLAGYVTYLRDRVKSLFGRGTIWWYERVYEE